MEDLVKMNTSCVDAMNTQLCDVVYQLDEHICTEECAEGGHKNVICVEMCESVLILKRDICNDGCPTSKHLQFSDPTTTTGYVTDYVACAGQCLLRSEVWDCDGVCQPHSVPCKERCPQVQCTGVDWVYHNIRGECLKFHNLVRCVFGASFPIYTSGITGLSTVSNPIVFSGIWLCPQTHCRSRTGSKCCKLVWSLTSKGWRCPSDC